MQRSSCAVLSCWGCLQQCDGISRSLGGLVAKPLERSLRCGGLPRSAGSVRHFPIPGVLTLQGGAREAVIMHVYLRSQRRGDAVVFRGFMFAESVERDWYSLLVAPQPFGARLPLPLLAWLL